MMRKMFFAALLGVFAVLSVSAQNKVGNFLGTWKLTKAEGLQKGAAIKSQIVNVSLVGDSIQIEIFTQGTSSNKQDYSTTVTNLYKISGATETNLAGGDFGGVTTSYMRYLGDNKLRFRWALAPDYDRPRGGRSQTEDWTLSSDGKTLTVEPRANWTSLRKVYSKQ